MPKKVFLKTRLLNTQMYLNLMIAKGTENDVCTSSLIIMTTADFENAIVVPHCI